MFFSLAYTFYYILSILSILDSIISSLFFAGMCAVFVPERP